MKSIYSYIIVFLLVMQISCSDKITLLDNYKMSSSSLNNIQLNSTIKVSLVNENWSNIEKLLTKENKRETDRQQVDAIEMALFNENCPGKKSCCF